MDSSPTSGSGLPGSGIGDDSGFGSSLRASSTPLQTDQPTTPTRPQPRRPARVYNHNDGRASSPIGTTYSPGGSGQDTIAATSTRAATPAINRPQTPETPDVEIRRRQREAAVDAPTSVLPEVLDFGFDHAHFRAQRLARIKKNSVQFVAGRTGRMTVVRVPSPPLSYNPSPASAVENSFSHFFVPRRGHAPNQLGPTTTHPHPRAPNNNAFGSLLLRGDINPPTPLGPLPTLSRPTSTWGALPPSRTPFASFDPPLPRLTATVSSSCPPLPLRPTNVASPAGFTSAPISATSAPPNLTTPVPPQTSNKKRLRDNTSPESPDVVKKHRSTLN